MVSHEERIHYYIRSVEAESLLSGHQFRPLFSKRFSLLKKSSTYPQSGLTFDGEDVPTSRRRTANQKNVHLELILGQVEMM